MKTTKATTRSQVVNVVIRCAKRMRDQLREVDFSEAVPWVYHPLDYAWKAHDEYLRRFAYGTKRVLFVGMNPGPWGMVQTGVPFGEVAAVRDWLGIRKGVSFPKKMHPKRPIEGFCCKRSEVSGRRFWGMFRNAFGTPEAFFADHFVVNYCPVAFMEDTGRNVTPDKLPKKYREIISGICNEHLCGMVEILDPEWIVGVGGFAEKCAEQCVAELRVRNHGRMPLVGKMLHPSPASPAANRDWENLAMCQLREQRIWTK